MQWSRCRGVASGRSDRHREVLHTNAPRSNGRWPPSTMPGDWRQHESEMYQATPQSILDWARDQLGLGASQLGRVEGFHKVLGKMPSAGITLKVQWNVIEARTKPRMDGYSSSAAV